MATYRMLLADKNGQNLGELRNATNASFTRVLNGIDTASFTLPIADPLARQLMTDDSIKLKIIRVEPGATQDVIWGVTHTMVFYGFVVDVEAIYAGTSGSIQVNAASPLWRLQRRIVGKDAPGQPRTVKPLSGRRDQLIRQVLEEAQAGGAVVALPGNQPSSVATIDDYSWRTAAEVIAELSRGQLGSAASDGIDFNIRPVDYTGTQFPWLMGEMILGSAAWHEASGKALAPTLYGRRLDDTVVFEAGPGTRGSALEVRETISRGGVANAVWHIIDEGQPVLFKENAAAIAARGLQEAVITEDISDEDYRRQLIDITLSIRESPRRVLAFTPAPEDSLVSVPRAYTEYEIGDIVGLRAVDPAGVVAINAAVRVYEMTTQVDDSGTGRHALTVVPEP